MGNMAINTNVLALNSHRAMKSVGNMQANASARLSSGQKINSAADDAAGLAISEKMRAQIKGLDMASKNSQDAVSMIQTAEGGMQEIDNMLQRVRELTVQASNDTNEHNTKGTGDRQKLQDEINQLVTEIDSMSDRVEFNNKKLLNGDSTNAVQRSSEINSRLNKIGDATTAGTEMKDAFDKLATLPTIAEDGGATAITPKTDDADLDTGAKVQAHLKEVDAFVKDVLDGGGSISDDEMKAIDQYKKDIVSAGDLAQEKASLNNQKTNMNTEGKGVYFQVGANANQGMSISINSVKSDVLGIGDGNGKTNIDVLKASGEEITGTLNKLDNALSYVTTERSKLGAAQNRLEYTMKSLDISSENLSAAESRIRDTDMAKEMMNLTKSNVLSQAATSMLSQANQAPQSVLKLLN